MDYATLSNEEGYTVFEFENYRIRFKAPYSLEHYISVKEWDNGYLVVMANIVIINDTKRNILI